jgi:predicted amino acid-binding ACT domain protein
MSSSLVLMLKKGSGGLRYLEKSALHSLDSTASAVIQKRQTYKIVQNNVGILHAVRGHGKLCSDILIQCQLKISIFIQSLSQYFYNLSVNISTVSQSIFLQALSQYFSSLSVKTVLLQSLSQYFYCLSVNISEVSLSIFPQSLSQYFYIGLGTEFRSEKIPRNRLGTASVIPRKKVLIPRHSEFRGRAHSEARNGTERKNKFSLNSQNNFNNMICPYLESILSYTFINFKIR